MGIGIGIGLGGWPFLQKDPAELLDFIAAAEALEVDSIWLSDRVVSEAFSLEPVVALSVIAAGTKTMKFGTSVLALPLRNPTILAKELGTLDFLSNGRLLLAVGLGRDEDIEPAACGIQRRERSGRTEEAVHILRELWSRDHVTFHGRFFTLDGVSIAPKPVQKDLPPIWIGGRSTAALRRTARLGDGWLASQVSPEEVRSCVDRIRAFAEAYERRIEADHFGVLLNYYCGQDQTAALQAARPYALHRRSDLDLTEFSALGNPQEIIGMLDRYIASGASKFVLRPACSPEQMGEQLSLLGREIIPHY